MWKHSPSHPPDVVVESSSSSTPSYCGSPFYVWDSVVFDIPNHDTMFGDNESSVSKESRHLLLLLVVVVMVERGGCFVVVVVVVAGVAIHSHRNIDDLVSSSSSLSSSRSGSAGGAGRPLPLRLVVHHS